MSKEDIPGYHTISCCGVCKYNVIELVPTDSEATIWSKCTKYMYQVSANGCCDSFEEGNANE